ARGVELDRGLARRVDRGLGGLRVGCARLVAVPSSFMKRLLAALFLVAIAVSGEAREGFGFMKKAVDMTRTIPPATNAGARRVEVKVDADRGSDEDDARTLERYINDHILAGNGTVAEGG